MTEWWLKIQICRFPEKQQVYWKDVVWKGSEGGLERTPGCHTPVRGWTEQEVIKKKKYISEHELISASSDLCKKKKYGNAQTCSDPRSPPFFSTAAAGASIGDVWEFGLLLPSSRRHLAPDNGQVTV